MKCWITAVVDIESSSELKLFEAEIAALRCQRRVEMRYAFLRDGYLEWTNRSPHSLEFWAYDLDLRDIRRLLARSAYVGAALIEEGNTDSWPGGSRVFKTSDGHELTGVLPLQRLYEVSTYFDKGDAAISNFREAAWNVMLSGRPDASPSSRKKNEYLTHNLHKYKAKFFPRLARALINICTRGGTGLTLDPMAGSGTTNLEASLLGIPSVGFDIDPLSCLIADTKANSLYSPAQVQVVGTSRVQRDQLSFLSGSSAKAFRLPSYIRRKIDPDIAAEIEHGVGALAADISALERPLDRRLGEVLMSHAIATKISLRWMGTGDNRFSISTAHRGLEAIFQSHAKKLSKQLYVAQVFSQAEMLPRALATIGTADARNIPLEDETVDAVVTSPPYLPAASGRETYLRSRGPSLVALGLLDEEEILHLERDVIGSILTAPADGSPLPKSVVDLVNWMRPQRERAPKAEPTAAYFGALRQMLSEIARVLKPGGRAAVVMSSQHHFYELTSRNLLRTFDMAKAVKEIAIAKRFGVGLLCNDVIRVELPKMDYAARPASRHEYAEAILLFQKK